MATFLERLLGSKKPEGPTSMPSSHSDSAPSASFIGGLAQTVRLRLDNWNPGLAPEYRFQIALMLLLAAVGIINVFGARANRAQARAWFRAHVPTVCAEFTSIKILGQEGGVQADRDTHDYEDLEKQLMRGALFTDVALVATGRRNVARLVITLGLIRWSNPISSLVSYAAGYLFNGESERPRDTAQLVAYPSDGRGGKTALPGAEAGLLPARDRSSGGGQAYDNFVWAIAHKRGMRRLRDSRYDLSITTAKDHPKLPPWAIVMSESAEITETMLTPELLRAVEAAGDLFEYIIISDLPSTRPDTAEGQPPHRRVILRHRMPALSSTDGNTALVPLIKYFVRLPDELVRQAHFRPEVLRKLQANRDELLAKIKRETQTEAEEDRTAARNRARKEKRDAELKALDARGQKRYLEREREKEMRKREKKVRG